MLLNTDCVTAISARQLEYEIETEVLNVIDVPLPNTTRVIGITQRASLVCMVAMRLVPITRCGKALKLPTETSMWRDSPAFFRNHSSRLGYCLLPHSVATWPSAMY